jgi:hypothetical protein
MASGWNFARELCLAQLVLAVIEDLTTVWVMLSSAMNESVYNCRTN